MTRIELMTWLILSLELSAGLALALIALSVWTWRRQRTLAGSVDRLVGQIERTRKLRGGELTRLLGERCPAEALEEAVQVCLDRERALLLAVAESLRQRGEGDAGRLPSAVQALTEAAVEAGQRSVPPEDPNPELLEQNAELREAQETLARRLAETDGAREELAHELAETREAFEVLDQEYRAAFERQAKDAGDANSGSAGARPAAVAPAARSDAGQATTRPAEGPEATVARAGASPAAAEVAALAAVAAEGPGMEGLAEAVLEDDFLPPPDMDLDGLAAGLESLGGLGPEPANPAPLASSPDPESMPGELIRIDDDEVDELVPPPLRAGAR